MQLTIHEITQAILMAFDRLTSGNDFKRHCSKVTLFNQLVKLAIASDGHCNSVSDLADMVEREYRTMVPWRID